MRLRFGASFYVKTKALKKSPFSQVLFLKRKKSNGDLLSQTFSWALSCFQNPSIFLWLYSFLIDKTRQSLSHIANVSRSLPVKSMPQPRNNELKKHVGWRVGSKCSSAANCIQLFQFDDTQLMGHTFKSTPVSSALSWRWNWIGESTPRHVHIFLPVLPGPWLN